LGPPGLLGVFQAGIYAGVAMYFPMETAMRGGHLVVVGPPAAYVGVMYVVQLIWQTAAAGIFLVGDRSARATLAHTPGIAEDAPASIEAPSEAA
jgi:hypothetical protein